MVEKTLHEAWASKNPSLEHFIVFGCDDHVHVPKENRSTLDNKDEKCIFIGLKDGLKGYKLWNVQNKKVLYNWDIVFREAKYVIQMEVVLEEKELETIVFELEGEESNST